MKTMTVSFLLVAAMATTLFLLVWFLTSNVEAGKGAAAFAVTALPGISSWLEHLEAKKSSSPGEKMAIRSLEGFWISLPVVVALGTIIAFAVLNLGNFLAGLVAGALERGQEGGEGELLRITLITQLPIFAVGFYLLGKWVSWRCARNGILAVIFVALLTAILTKLVDFTLMSPKEWQALYRVEKTVQGTTILVFSQFAFVAVPMLLGFWRGRRQRTSKYMEYLLLALPEGT